MSILDINPIVKGAGDGVPEFSFTKLVLLNNIVKTIFFFEGLTFDKAILGQTFNDIVHWLDHIEDRMIRYNFTIWSIFKSFRASVPNIEGYAK